METEINRDVERGCRMNKEMTPMNKRIFGIGFGVFLLLIWEILSLQIQNSFMLPGPADVVRSLIENRVELFTVHLPATMAVVLTGGVSAVLIGLFFALVMDRFPGAAHTLYPIFTISQTLPITCIAPVFVLWLGYTMKTRVLLVILMNFFAVTVDFYDGLQSTAPERIDLLRTYGADRRQELICLRFPTALPNLFSALHIVIPWSVVGAAVSEWLGAPYGLGTYSRYCLGNLDAAGLLAPLFILSLVALTLNGAVTLAERKTLEWM